MQKKCCMIMWVALLVGQAPLASSVVICTTEDGQSRLEKPDHHGHGHLADSEEDHNPPDCHAHACPEHVVPAACCRDLAMDYVSPSLVQAKRVVYDVDALSPLNRVVYSKKQHLGVSAMSYTCLDTDPGILRSVILLI